MTPLIFYTNGFSDFDSLTELAFSRCVAPERQWLKIIHTAVLPLWRYSCIDVPVKSVPEDSRALTSAVKSSYIASQFHPICTFLIQYGRRIKNLALRKGAKVCKCLAVAATRLSCLRLMLQLWSRSDTLGLSGKGGRQHHFLLNVT